jgi:hypothetical protein
MYIFQDSENKRNCLQIFSANYYLIESPCAVHGILFTEGLKGLKVLILNKVIPKVHIQNT